mmetsp:Transcript_44942/g.140771  ORF Transcript_44942/g.140771 Transcript_44942/m.140771 type:complete len:317 (-) Transcript_44942:1362-2312(-)
MSVMVLPMSASASGRPCTCADATLSTKQCRQRVSKLTQCLLSTPRDRCSSTSTCRPRARRGALPPATAESSRATMGPSAGGASASASLAPAAAAVSSSVLPPAASSSSASSARLLDSSRRSRVKALAALASASTTAFSMMKRACSMRRSDAASGSHCTRSSEPSPPLSASSSSKKSATRARSSLSWSSSCSTMLETLWKPTFSTHLRATSWSSGAYVDTMVSDVSCAGGSASGWLSSRARSGVGVLAPLPISARGPGTSLSFAPLPSGPGLWESISRDMALVTAFFAFFTAASALAAPSRSFSRKTPSEPWDCSRK